MLAEVERRAGARKAEPVTVLEAAAAAEAAEAAEAEVVAVRPRVGAPLLLPPASLLGARASRALAFARTSALGTAAAGAAEEGACSPGALLPCCSPAPSSPPPLPLPLPLLVPAVRERVGRM
jgi:hypothetical protein